MSDRGPLAKPVLAKVKFVTSSFVSLDLQWHLIEILKKHSRKIQSVSISIL